MRLRLEATPEELYEQGERLVEALAKSLVYANPDLADVLEKALPAKESDLKFQVLRDLKAHADKEYAATIERMLDDILGVLEAGVVQKSGPYIGPKGGLWADPQHTQHWAPEHAGALESFAAKFGGKVVPHFTDPGKVVVKLPPQHAKVLADLKAQQNLPDPIIAGGKYVMLSVPKTMAPKPVPAAAKPPAPKPAPFQAPVQPAPSASAPKGKGVPYAAHKDWKPHASVEEATAWAKSLGVDVDFKDLDTANEVNRVLSEQHGMLLKHVEFMGSQKGVRAWAKAHPEVNKRAMTDAKHPKDLTQFHLGGGAIAEAHPTTKKPYTKSVVVVRDDWATAAAAKAKHKMMVPGFTRGDSLQDTLRHEMGHVEGFVFRHLFPNGPGQPSAWEIWKAAAVGALKHAQKDVMKQVSEYGATNPHECWAEISVMRRQGVELPQWVQVAIKKMRIEEVPWEKMAAPGGAP